MKINTGKVCVSPVPVASDNPVSTSDSGDITIRNVGFATSNQALEISLADGKVANIEKSDGLVDWVCLPPLVDKHVHANRAFTLTGSKPDSFEHGIALTIELFRDFTSEKYCSHARRLFERAHSHGTTGVRTHADIDGYTDLNAVQGTLDAKAAFAETMDIEVVAFASSRLDPASKNGQVMIREAINRGANLIGAVPALYQNPKRSIDAMIEMAIELDVAIDVHQDEHLNADNVSSEYLADAIISNGYQGRLTLSHGCALSVLEPDERNRIIDKLAEAQIDVVVLPITNLYLQDRQSGTPIRRGLTCVHELISAGVEIRFATDSVCDAFYPYGDADLLDTAYVAMLASQLDATDILVKSICDGRSDISIGDDANLVLIKGNNFDEVLSKRPAERINFRGGKLQLN